MNSLDAGFKIEIDINLSRERMLSKFIDPKLYPEWQEKLISYEVVPQKPPHDLHIMNLEYDFGGQNIKIIRTVLSDSLPQKNVVLYEVQGMRCLMENEFTEFSADACQWLSVIKVSSTSDIFKEDFQVMVEVFGQYFKGLQTSFKHYVEAI